jgi:ABC-type transport system involved in multi-copper enzyme maturation permease subunit
MTAGAITGYRSKMPAGRDGFAQLLHAEWTKFRTVRGWLIGFTVAALLIVALGVLTAAGTHSSVCHNAPGQSAPVCTGPPAPLTGPGGEPVNDGFYFVHQPLTGNGSITVRVNSLTGLIAASGGAPPDQPLTGTRPGVQAWSKAGLIIKASTTPGSAYAAIMVTGRHGVRWQYNYTHDTAGFGGAVSAAASPHWLRLTRSGDLVTGYDSTDGSHWTEVGSVRLTGLPTTVPGGLFTASPDYEQTSHPVGGGESGSSLPTRTTARFDRLSLHGGWLAGAWTGTQISDVALPGGFTQAGDTITVSGSGDIAPVVSGSGGPDPDRTLIGTFAGLIALIVVAGLFVTSEYRRGLIRTTLTASPRRGRVLAAKAVVIGAATFLTGLVAATITVLLGRHLLHSNGHFLYPVNTLTGLRLIVGTAALLAVAAVAALALSTILRRGAGAVTAVIVAIVLPYILAVASVLPVGAGQWLLRLTPAAAFAVQQTLIQYPQVAGDYTPTAGYYPLSPWAGLAVLCGYTAIALLAAAVLLRRRDA